MRNKEKTYTRLITSMEQVDISFKLLSSKRQIEELNKGIYLLLKKLGNTEVNYLFEQYPRLIQKYSINELLSDTLKIPNVNASCLKLAGLLTYLQFLISGFTDFIDESGNSIPLKKNDNSIPYKAESYIINSISLDDYFKELFLIVLSIVGEDYYKKFSTKIGSANFKIDDILKLEKDKDLREHIDLMAWFCLIKIFLESVYFYFDSQNHYSKNL